MLSAKQIERICKETFTPSGWKRFNGKVVSDKDGNFDIDVVRKPHYYTLIIQPGDTVTSITKGIKALYRDVMNPRTFR